MRPRDLFGVAVRVIGLWLLTQAAYWGFIAMLKSSPGLGNPNIPRAEDVAFAVYYCCAGLLLIVLADTIVRAVYGPQLLRLPEDRAELSDTGTARREDADQ